jgi:hypothetical protein
MRLMYAEIVLIFSGFIHAQTASPAKLYAVIDPARPNRADIDPKSGQP